MVVWVACHLHILAMAHSQVHRDVAYGSAPRQTLDLYFPSTAKEEDRAPLLIFVHGYVAALI